MVTVALPHDGHDTVTLAALHSLPSPKWAHLSPRYLSRSFINFEQLFHPMLYGMSMEKTHLGRESAPQNRCAPYFVVCESAPQNRKRGCKRRNMGLAPTAKVTTIVTKAAQRQRKGSAPLTLPHEVGCRANLNELLVCHRQTAHPHTCSIAVRRAGTNLQPKEYWVNTFDTIQLVRQNKIRQRAPTAASMWRARTRSQPARTHPSRSTVRMVWACPVV